MIIYVKVIPNSVKKKIEKVSENQYIIHLTEKPLNGKANTELIKLLSKEFGVPYKKINIKNPLSRKKIIEIL